MNDLGYVSVHNGKIVDESGRPLLLRGMGLGNWLLAEGYMWKLSPGRESAREIEALVVELVGSDRATMFWRRFRDQFVNADDIHRIAAEGMDHVRLPINWRVVMTDDGTIRPDGFDRIDALIRWCRDAGIRVLLDLHGAPGGQTGTNIDDSLGSPELFMRKHFQDLTEQLWVVIARRYRDEPVVLGYDLLNEPLPNEWQHRYPDELVALYRRLTASIRAVDDRHLIMYEGSHWATNWSIFTEVWDANSVLQFHKYWSPPDRQSIQHFIDIGDRLGLPIYMGEGGENNTDWLATAFQLYEDHDIGWNFWPWKKIDTRTSPCSVVAPAGWDSIVEFANGTGEKPDADHAWSTLAELADATALDRCEYHTDVVNATLRRAPLSLPATAFGFRGPDLSFSTKAGASIVPDFRSDDDVRIELGDNLELPAFDQTDGMPDRELLVLLDRGDWTSYSVEVPDGVLTIVVTTDVRGTREGQSAPDVELDGVVLGVESRSSGRTTYSSPDIDAARSDLRVTATADGTALRRIDVMVDPTPSPDIERRNKDNE